MKTAITFLTTLWLTACGLLGSGGSGPRTIVFAAADEEGTYQIYTMRGDGSGIRRLTDGEYSSTAPAWSPNGQRIAYTAHTPEAGGETLWVMDANGANQRPLVTNPRTGHPQPGTHPAWSPDGSKLAFERCLDCERGGSNHELFLADLQTGAIDTLTRHPVADRHPTWSPDGQQIAFASNRDYFDADTMRWRQDLYVIDVNERNLTRLTEPGNATRPAWSPDGSKIAYEWNIRGNEVFIYHMASDHISNIETGLEFAGGGMWNNNGTQLLVSGRKSEEASPEMRLLNVEVEPPEVLQSVILNKNAIGKDYDWHNGQ